MPDSCTICVAVVFDAFSSGEITPGRCLRQLRVFFSELYQASFDELCRYFDAGARAAHS